MAARPAKPFFGSDVARQEVPLPTEDISPPRAEPRPHRWTFGDQAWDDEYAWLENPGDPEVLAYLRAENEFRAAIMAPTAALQDTLYREMLGRVKETDASVPVVIGEWEYFIETEAGQQYPRFCRQHPSEPASRAVLLDLNAMVGPSGFIALRGWRISPDQRYLAYRLNESGGLEGSIRFLELATGATLPERLEPAGPGFEWTNDGAGLYWETQQADSLRSYRVRVHRPGTSAEADAEVYVEPDVAYETYLGKARDDSFIFIQLDGGESTEVRYLPAASLPATAPILFAPRRPGIEYDLEHRDGEFLIRTNDGAENFQVLAAPVDDPSATRGLIPHDPTVLLSEIVPFADRLVVIGRADGYAQVFFWDEATAALAPVAWPDAAHALAYASDANPRYDAAAVRIRYSSLTTPASIYDVALMDGALTLLKQTEIPSGHDPADYVTEQLSARAEDGAAVPISLLRRRDQPAGPQPLLLNAYGSYGFSFDPWFRSELLSLVDRGVTYAIAHIRGGSELGRHWYKQGKMLHKRNTFTDFIAAGDALIAAGRTTSDQLVISGGSAGGLLMGAVTNFRPDLARLVVAAVPFVDVMRVMFDESLPLTTGEFTEWGNPVDPAFFAYMRSYSPYDNVAAAAYPEMLLTAGLNDDQVPYWQPAKWLARMRVQNTGERQQYLRINLGAGHSGSSGRYDNLREIAHDYAFMLRALGLTNATVAG